MKIKDGSWLGIDVGSAQKKVCSFCLIESDGTGDTTVEVGHQEVRLDLGRSNDSRPVFVDLGTIGGTVFAELHPDFVHALGEVLSGQGLDVLAGNKVIEVRPTGLNKGMAARTILESYDTAPDWILAAGDDTTDEDLFRAMPSKALTLLVGERPTSAHFRLPSCSAMLDQLERWYEPHFQATRTQS